MTRTLSHRGLLGLGLLLLAAGALLFAARARFVERSDVVEGTVAYTTRYTLGVQPDGEGPTVSVRRPFLHLYGRGQRVRIRLDRDAALPGRLGVAGRIDSFAGLWLLPSLLAAFGLLLTAGSIASARGRGLRLALSFGRR
jgi:hypothetical protein